MSIAAFPETQTPASRVLYINSKDATRFFNEWLSGSDSRKRNITHTTRG